MNNEIGREGRRFRVVAFDSKTRTYRLELIEDAGAAALGVTPTDLTGAPPTLQDRLSEVPSPFLPEDSGCWVKTSAALKLGETVRGVISPQAAIAPHQPQFSTFTLLEKS